MESSLPPQPSDTSKDNEQSENGTDYSSFPNSPSPISKISDPEFVVTIGQSESVLPSKVDHPKVRAPSPNQSSMSPPRRIEVVSGFSGRSPSSILIRFPNSSSPACARLSSRVRITDVGRVEHLPVPRRRVGWKSVAVPMSTKPIPLNSIRFTSPPRRSAARSVALSENLVSIPPGVYPSCQTPIPTVEPIPSPSPKLFFFPNPISLPIAPVLYPVGPSRVPFPFDPPSQ
ncbi:hypothetical protein niasHT_028430 [Heterodera trifolii]|uniref:Uncharacterized protein n=1 Tax=Heterodera trifolii TaxID=157864 RepID=A0ABD2JKP1_9BILA